MSITEKLDEEDITFSSSSSFNKTKTFYSKCCVWNETLILFVVSFFFRVTPASSPIWTGQQTASTSSPTQETTRSSSVGPFSCLCSQWLIPYPLVLSSTRISAKVTFWLVAHIAEHDDSFHACFFQGRHPVVNMWPTWTRCATWSGRLIPALWPSIPLVGRWNSLDIFIHLWFDHLEINKLIHSANF